MNCMVQCYISDIVGNRHQVKLNQITYAIIYDFKIIIICYKHWWGFARIFWWFWLLSDLFVSVGVTYLPNPHDIDGLLMVDTKYIYTLVVESWIIFGLNQKPVNDQKPGIWPIWRQFGNLSHCDMLPLLKQNCHVEAGFHHISMFL